MNDRLRAASFALGILANAVAIRAGQPPIEQTAPRAGAVFLPGERIEIAWRPLGSSPPAFEEWEAFLSLDGGETHPVRLTPHLDATISSFWVELPAVPSATARILIRVGDEREETNLEPMGSFEIRGGMRAFTWPARHAAVEGERARPGEAPTRRWAQGDRSGRRVNIYETTAANFGLRSRLDALPIRRIPGVLRARRPSMAAAANSVELNSRVELVFSPSSPPRVTAIAEAIPPGLRIHRFNV